MIEIRETKREDLPEIQKLWADGEVMYFVGFPKGLCLSLEQMCQWYQRLENNRPKRNHYVIFENGVFCGETFYALGSENERSASLDIKLFPFARGRGIATKALSYAIEEAFRHGAETVWVDPNADNTKALALYEKLGFQKKERPNDLSEEADGATYVYMERKRKGQR